MELLLNDPVAPGSGVLEKVDSHASLHVPVLDEERGGLEKGRYGDAEAVALLQKGPLVLEVVLSAPRGEPVPRDEAAVEAPKAEPVVRRAQLLAVRAERGREVERVPPGRVGARQETHDRVDEDEEEQRREAGDHNPAQSDAGAWDGHVAEAVGRGVA